MGIYLLLYHVARIIIFPGSNYLYLLCFEREREIALTNTVLDKLKKFIASLPLSNPNMNYESLLLLVKAKSQIKTILKIFRANAIAQIKHGKLTNSQNELNAFNNQIYAQLKQITIKIIEKDYKLSKLDMRNLQFIKSEGKIVDMNQIQQLAKYCNRLEQFLNKFTDSKKWYERLIRLFRGRAMGHLQYMRAETLRLFNAEEITLRVKDGITIDGMILPAISFVNNLPRTTNKSIALLCNPNAGYYEFSIDYQSNWINFYAERNFDICIWNYRGYGRSQGLPNPDNIVSDGLELTNFLKMTKEYKRILVHGESLGGAVAVKLGLKGGCDFIFADRTFCDILLDRKSVVRERVYVLV